MVLRPPTADDRQRILALLHDAEEVEAGSPVSTLADVDDLLAAPGLRLDERARIQLDGQRATGFVALHPAPQPGELRAHLILAPDASADAPELLTLIDGWAQGDRPTRAPVTATLFELPGFVARDALIAGGWTIVHSYTRMRAHLTTDIGDELPDGVDIHAASSGDDMALIHAVLEDAIAGHWKHQRRAFPAFLADQQGRPGYDPSLWLLATYQGTPAGAVIVRDPADRAWIAWLGVRTRYRKRGVAQALLRTAFDELRRRGHRTVGVDVDTHNETGAGLVYERAGMTVVGRADQWSRTYE